MATKSLSELRKSSKDQFSKLKEAVDKLNKPSDYASKNEGEWKLTPGKDGNGYAVIRFLPAPKGEDIPWARLFNHFIKGKSGKYYVENSRTTIGEPDPVSEYNSVLWNTGIESDKKIARDQKRKLNYLFNVLVVKDPANPANEGKVFIYKCGKKIFDKINAKWNPEPEYEGAEPAEATDPLDIDSGSNFILKMAKVAGFPNYDKSYFADPSPLAETDEEIEAIWAQCKSLKAYVAPDQFKPYDVLKAQFERDILGGESTPASTTTEEEVAETKPAPKPKPAPKAKAPVLKVPAEAEDDDLAHFAALAAEADDEE